MPRRRKSHDPKPTVTIWPGTTPFFVWMRWYRAQGQEGYAHWCEQQTCIQVPTQFPETGQLDLEASIACAKK